MYAEPSEEVEIVRAVRNAAKVRVFGAAHSFNEGNVSEQLLISLDNYSGLVSKDLATSQVTVRGGTRVRDVVKLLAQDDLAFAALPSHDAQSIAGILSTDVHGTGRDWGFVSSSVVRLKLLDGNGAIIVCGPADDLFKAAIGGVGAVGIMLEVTVQGVPRFNINQRVDIRDLAAVKRSLDALGPPTTISVFTCFHSATSAKSTSGIARKRRKVRGQTYASSPTLHSMPC